MTIPYQTIESIIDGQFSGLIASMDAAAPGKYPGIVVGVTVSGTKYYFPYGEIPMAGGGTPPATEDIVMLIGSNTKVFSATLLALAAIQPPSVPITLDTAAAALVPSGTTINLYDGDPIRLWHLATHSAGFPDGPCGQTVWGNYTFDQTANFLSAFTPPYEPGTYWVYSDQSFALLGVLLSHAYTSQSGASSSWDGTYQAWPTIAADNIIVPLGMTTTQVDFTPVISQLAMPYSYVGGSQPYYQAVSPPTVVLDSAALGAGALSSTLCDMLTFLQSQIAPPSNTLGKAIALTQQEQGGLSMGLGWQIGNGFFYKDGLVPGYTSYMAVDPTNQIGLIAMGNCQPGDDGVSLGIAGRQALGALRGSTATAGHCPAPPPGETPQCPS
jgi:beta-lactamase class C